MEPAGCTGLDALVEGLKKEFETNPRGPGAKALLSTYAAQHDDWRQFVHWSDERYTRNQIARTEAFELILLCWGEGQKSPIHNHEDRNCWMGVLEGQIEEVQYAFPTGEAGPLTELGSQVFRGGEVAFIRDEIGLHLVQAYAGPGVSLHLYAAPYDSCNVYCPETGRIERVHLSYHSIRGELVAR
ncbi:MAG: cysteine dioxygenase family protein [Planctomycetota bacterium]